MTDSNPSSETRMIRILLPTDGSEKAARGANIAIEVAKKFGAEHFFMSQLTDKST